MKKIPIVLYVLFLIILAFLLKSPKGAFAGGNIVLWNKLGSAEEMANSEIGPNGSLYGSIDFVPGRFGNGFSS
ncbi:MAG: hypothetical protein PVH87_18485, partial [Desulfobacteraceae bacterium]